ncbi:hypothetical protein A3L04_06740 [Thermococcus chitonophagus]|uniref:Uncharacterized protein n=1 Tax=Thermococcus chitonophagus TaxID=54262 RepID=A0A160VT57_9EURY|nr:hypothetical protein [Thermococcus chitonophagus]ASJ16793.1 hypothetical protein A3L04_06740 [Thermococcus chitonophagus]CUX78265.1 hypothetical protein CHITON_1486 [Thermococcus chitonophagus]
MIYDLGLMKKFFEKVLVELKEEEVYTLFLMTRRKWFSRLSSNYELLDYKVLTEFDFKRFYRAVLRLVPQECAYIDVRTEECIPVSAMALYVDVIPRDIKKGVVKTLQDFINLLAFQENVGKLKKFNRVFLSNLQKSPGRKPYFIIDVDSKNTQLVDYIIEQLNNYSIPARWISETKGGFHIIVRRDGEWMRAFYKEVLPRLNHENVEVKLEKSILTPIPGTLQAGFPVKGGSYAI